MKLKKNPATIAEYIRAAPRDGQPHLCRLYAILKSVAPEAQEVIKWGTPSGFDRTVKPETFLTQNFLTRLLPPVRPQ